MPDPAAVPVTCPSCGATGRVPAAFAGRSVTCKKCGQGMTVPAPVKAAVADEAPAGQATPPARRRAPGWVVPAAVGGFVVLFGGYFVYQDQQDRAARAAYSDCVAAWKQVILSTALVDIERTKKRDELRAAGVGDEESYQRADAYAKASQAGLDEAIYMSQASRLAARWGDRWARLGLRQPGP